MKHPRLFYHPAQHHIIQIIRRYIFWIQAYAFIFSRIRLTTYIDRVGSGVERVRAGDRVTAFTRFGGYASHVVVDSRAVVSIPEDMDAGVAAALATQYCTAWYAAEEMVRLHKGDHVLIQAAAGGVGMALVQIAMRRSAEEQQEEEEKLKKGMDILEYQETEYWKKKARDN